MDNFRTKFGKAIYEQKYGNGLSWDEKARVLVNEVDRRDFLKQDEKDALVEYIRDMKFLPGGRYLYYGGQPANFYNNCFCFRALEDTREEWARLSHNAFCALMCGGGIGVDYSVLRGAGDRLFRTGGISSGPIPLMKALNDSGRQVQQGGSRRSALYASLHHSHPDIIDFIHAKDWSREILERKAEDFNYEATLDMTNISVNVDEYCEDSVLLDAVLNMCITGEPGLSFNFGNQRNETLRNACTEFISEDDSDACNLGSVNFANIKNVEELKNVTYLAAKFLVLGGEAAELPYDKVREIREKNRSIGLGLMGFHEWLLQRGYQYSMPPELRGWMGYWRDYSEKGANDISRKMDIRNPKRYRAIAPTGTIGILAGTTTGIEPLFATAYKRRFLVGNTWHYEYIVDATADLIIKKYNLDPSEVETAVTLGENVERRIKTQAEVQEFVDMGISSTINLPPWGTEWNNNETAWGLYKLVQKYKTSLRGLTCYPDGARGGQPLEAVPYEEAKKLEGVRYVDNEENCKGGVCGL